MSAPDDRARDQRLRDELRTAAEGSAGASIDLDRVLSASRRARRNRVTAIAGGTAAVAALIAAAGLTGALSGLTGPAVTTADAPASVSQQGFDDAPSESESALESESARESAVAPRDEAAPGDVALGPLAMFNQCGQPVVPATDASQSPLTATVRADGPVIAGDTADAVVTMTNVSDATVSGELREAPAVAIADGDGVVVAMRPDIAAFGSSMPIELAPGEQVELPARIEAVSCTSGRAPSAIVPGAYAITATIAIVPDDSNRPVLAAATPLVPVRVE